MERIFEAKFSREIYLIISVGAYLLAIFIIKSYDQDIWIYLIVGLFVLFYFIVGLLRKRVVKLKFNFLENTFEITESKMIKKSTVNGSLSNIKYELRNKTGIRGAKYKILKLSEISGNKKWEIMSGRYGWNDSDPTKMFSLLEKHLHC